MGGVSDGLASPFSLPGEITGLDRLYESRLYQSE